MRSQKPDLVLLDLIMPGLDGFDLLNQMRAAPDLADIPVVLLTANNDIKEMHSENHIKIHHHDGLYPIEVLSCLNVVVNSLKPRYLAV